ncbi:MAG: hypothetical protein ABW100_19650, partial [Candidatus Thiodiazotropha sp. 6PLUC3]
KTGYNLVNSSAQNDELKRRQFFFPFKGSHQRAAQCQQSSLMGLGWVSSFPSPMTFQKVEGVRSRRFVIGDNIPGISK